MKRVHRPTGCRTRYLTTPRIWLLLLTAPRFGGPGPSRSRSWPGRSPLVPAPGRGGQKIHGGCTRDCKIRARSPLRRTCHQLPRPSLPSGWPGWGPLSGPPCRTSRSRARRSTPPGLPRIAPCQVQPADPSRGPAWFQATVQQCPTPPLTRRLSPLGQGSSISRARACRITWFIRCPAHGPGKLFTPERTYKPQIPATRRPAV